MITIQRGNDVSVQWTIKNISGETVDFSGCDITFAVRSKLKGAFFVIPTSTDAGVIKVNIPGNVLPVGNFYLDVEWNKPISGRKVYWRARTEELIKITDSAEDFKTTVSVTAESAIVSQGYIVDTSVFVNKNNLAQKTGNSTTEVMSQKAVTDAISNISADVVLVQETGQSTDKAMSQKAVTDELTKIGERCDTIEDTATELNDMVVANKEETDAALNGLSGELENKQETLKSGVNIKTVNGQSILGPGNIVLSGTGGAVIPLKKGTETNYNTTTTTEAAGGELYYNSSTVKIYYRVGGVNYTDWNVEGFYTRADVCDSNGVPITGAFYLIDDELNIFNGTKMVLAYEGAKIHYLAGLLDITSNSTTQNLDFVLNDVVAFYNAISSRDTIFYDSHAEGLVLLSAFSTGIFDTEKTIQLSAILVNAQTNQQFVIHGEFVANITENKVTSITSWDKQILSNGGGISDAPSDGKVYSRINGKWEPSICYIDGLSTLMTSSSITPDDVERVFGTKDLTALKTKLLEKLIIDSSDIEKNIYVASISKTSVQEILSIYRLNRHGGTESRAEILDMVFPSSSGLVLSTVSSKSIKFVLDAKMDGKRYVRLNGQWFEDNGITDAPSDGKKYVRQNGSWVAID